MKKFKLLLIIVLALTFVQSIFSQTRINGKVVDVINGKTVVIEISDNRKITAELEYIEIPEPEQQLSQVVKEHLRNLLLGKKVEFTPQVIMPTYLVGKLFLGQVNIGQQMLRDGAAWYAVLDKDRQDAFESKNYQIVEAQAKLEKRGVWSIENLKPAWEFRAEKAAKASEPVENQEFLPTPVSAKKSTKRRYMTPEEQNQAKPLVGWASVVGVNEKKYLGIEGLYSGEFPEKRINYVYTSGTFLNLVQAKSSPQQVEFRAFYAYRGNQTNVEGDIFAIGFYSESKEYKFAKSDSLTIFADKKQVFSGKAVRFYNQGSSMVQELMIYKINKSALEKIVKASNSSFNLGGFSGGLNRGSQELVDKLIKTAN